MLDNALWEAYCSLVVAGPFTLMTVMHGKNRSGADNLADGWAVNRYYEGVRVKRVEARWSDPCLPTCTPRHRRWNGVSDFCPAQGNYRNQRMVDEHPLATLGFVWQEHSNGTWDCIHRSVKSGVPTLIYRRGRYPVWAVPDNEAWALAS
jgi:hypothetical protein